MSEEVPLKIDGRKSPENIARLKSQGFQKGRKKTGGRVALSDDIKQAMGEKTLEAVATMYELMNDAPNPMVRYKAAEYLLSAFVSKAATKVDVAHTHDIGAMLAEINSTRLKDDREARKTIDITPTRITENQSIDDDPGYSIV